ncbi:MAG: hypothetical protein ACOX5X_01400 [Acholeplasmataceae bacterium]|jgi:hypothetical protein
MLKREVYSLFILISTFVLLIGTVYAWFSITRVTETDMVELSVDSAKVETYLYVRKNDEDEQSIVNQDDLTDLLDFGIPGDNYYFRIKLINHSPDTKTVNISFKNMTNHGEVVGADIRDAYLLKDSTVYYDGVASILTPSGITLPPGYEGQALKPNRLRRFLNIDNNMILIQNEVLPANTELDITFQVTFDTAISRSAYRGYLKIEKLIVNIT